MKISLIVAQSENRVIGRNGDMPWRLSSDLKRFKSITMGHHIVMGRKTYESIGRLLPGRTTVIITRQPDYQVEGAVIADSLDSAIEQAAGDDELFIVGGGQIYASSLAQANKIYQTRVHTEINDGDTFFPEVDWTQWNKVHAEEIAADEKNDFETTYEVWERGN
ncbi:MAG: diacylglycerol kinase [Blastopirellula sp.]|nr:MAG: diacylglycerol kinase [Blastopirellula sp.]